MGQRTSVELPVFTEAEMVVVRFGESVHLERGYGKRRRANAESSASTR